MNMYSKLIYHAFADHKASIVENNDNFFVVDWRRSDGSSVNYVRYILDRRQGTLFVSGDLGNSVACWYNPVEPEDLKRYIGNIEYYMEKIRCSTDRFVYHDEDIRADLEVIFSDILSRHEDDTDEEMEEIQEDFEDIRDWFSEYAVGNRELQFSSDIIDTMSKYDEEWYDSFGIAGRRVAPRVYMWSAGYRMACKQLGI